MRRDLGAPDSALADGMARTVGFVVLLTLYASIGLMAAAGSIAITQRLLRPRWEQAFYAIFLIPIAAFYLAFAAYFSADAAWPTEASAVAAFAAVALAGVRMPLALVAGYLLHGVWDGLHEFQAHGGLAVFEPGGATPTPLAYGVFCAVYDLCMAAYFVTRRRAWVADRVPAVSAVGAG